MFSLLKNACRDALSVYIATYVCIGLNLSRLRENLDKPKIHDIDQPFKTFHQLLNTKASHPTTTLF